MRLSLFSNTDLVVKSAEQTPWSSVALIVGALGTWILEKPEQGVTASSDCKRNLSRLVDPDAVTDKL